uniref:GRAM domain containing 2A n=1 Tax=Hypotaenidia okinawae TaxID=2861861 RepID=A0A6G1RDN8_9GRUI
MMGSLLGSLLGPVLFNFINDLDNGTKYSLSKLADDRKAGVVDAPDGFAAFQRDRLEKRVGRNVMKCDKGKCKVMCHRRNDSTHQLEGSVLAKDMGVLVDTKLNTGPLCVSLQQRKLAAFWAASGRALTAGRRR